MFVYEAELGYEDKKGERTDNWSKLRFVADNFDDATKKALKHLKKKEYIVQVVKVFELDF